MYRKTAVFNRQGGGRHLRTFASRFEIKTQRVLDLLLNEGVSALTDDIHIFDTPNDEKLDALKEPGTIKTSAGSVICVAGTDRDAVIKAIAESLSLEDVELPGVDFSGMDLRGINFQSANLIDANFEGADLRGCDFRFADLRRANFSHTSLTDANFKHARLIDTIFSMTSGFKLSK